MILRKKIESYSLPVLLLLTCFKIPAFREEGLVLQYSLAALILVIFFFTKKEELQVSPILFIVVLTYFTWAIVSTIQAPSISLAVKSVSRDLVFAALIISVPYFLKHSSWLSFLKITFLLNAILSIYQKAAQGEDGTGLLHNPNILAFFICLSVVILLIKEDKKLIRLGFVVLAFFSIFSSGSWLYLGLFTLVFIVFGLNEYSPLSKRSVAKNVILIIAIASIPIFYYIIFSSSITVRFALWESSFKLFKTELIVGTGPGTWLLHFPASGQSELLSSFGHVVFLRPHSEWIRLFSEQGVLGALCVLIIFGFFFIKLFKSKYSINFNYLLIGMLTISADFSLNFSREIFSISLVVAILIAHISQPGIRTRNRFQLKYLLGVPLALIFLASIPYLYNSFQLQSAARGGQSLEAKQRKLENVNRTIFPLDPLSSESVDAVQGKLLLKTDIPKAKSLLYKAIELTPENCQTNLALANLLVQSNSEKALKYYDKSLQNCPCYLEAAIDKSVLIYNNGDPINAYRVLKASCSDNQTKTNNLKAYIQTVERQLEGSNSRDSIEMYRRFLDRNRY